MKPIRKYIIAFRRWRWRRQGLLPCCEYRAKQGIECSRYGVPTSCYVATSQIGLIRVLDRSWVPSFVASVIMRLHKLLATEQEDVK